MSKRQQVLDAIRRLVASAVPDMAVDGLEPDDGKPTRLGDGGQVQVQPGDPGEADVDLSPPTWWWEHGFPVNMAVTVNTAERVEVVLDAKLMAIGMAIAADRTLGGLCSYLDAEPPAFGETEKQGSATIGWADFTIIATYSTTSPLG
ncbi:hypothetical protein SAMN05192583_0887 [Sphingomonas gellani]|uniref:Uncharacterized protein n=1 Tax=Sphingomonas gellani TaxID=1166340 RepID=A0A1H7ZWI5_9SPHN|nr:hypothetical protein [Sphingomonas gellani]SEM62805.1 hypothetical protein SAMN05192583_0887 [Sphingomonas gellani]